MSRGKSLVTRYSSLDTLSSRATRPGLHGMNTFFPYHCQHLTQAVEDMIGTYDVGQAMAVQIGLQGRLRVCEHQHNAVAGQVFV